MTVDVELFLPNPGRSGSPACVSVLLTLNRWRSGLSFRELVAETGIDEDELRAALTGLADRKRIQCVGRGTAAKWELVYTEHFAYSPNAAQAYLALRGLQ